MKNPSKKTSAKKEEDVSAAAKLDAQQSTNKDEHTMPLEKLAEHLDTNPETGLVEAEAKIRLKRDGPNSMMDFLPQEILLLIFSNLDVKDLGNASLVCRTWKEVSHHHKSRFPP